MPKLSIVVCFKDWGIDRLEGVTRSIYQSGLGDLLEVIIADYGSVDSKGYRERLEALGARYFYFETNGVWSRSRALNLGIQKARGEYLVTTDSDMVFTPDTIPIVLSMMELQPEAYFILQCRDLPEGITHDDILESDTNWEKLDASSRLRPRWGMGGLIAFHRDAYVEMRGLDERLEIYGGEDIDLARRLMRTGRKRIWINHPNARMYHVWHPSSRTEADKTPEGTRAIQLNRQIQLHDVSIARNLKRWGGRPANCDPLVTVAISTFNRAEFLGQSVESVLSQSFKDFELIVVNDGSTDETRNVLDSFKDPRLRVVHQENRGLAAARNRITDMARGKYIAVHDDDDIMLPNRLERQLQSISSGYNGTYGGWVDFDNESGELSFNRGKRFSAESLLFNRGVYLHPTLMIQRNLLSAVRYDETMRSGSDYNLAVRLARAGAKLAHCGNYVTLRRTHEGQITNSHGTLQRVSGKVTSAFGRANMTTQEIAENRKERGKKDWVSVVSEDDVRPWITAHLPDHLARRSVKLTLVGDGEHADVSGIRSIQWNKVYKVVSNSNVKTVLESPSLTWDELQVVYRESPDVDALQLTPIRFEECGTGEIVKNPTSIAPMLGVIEDVIGCSKNDMDWGVVTIAVVEAADMRNAELPDGVYVLFPDDREKGACYCLSLESSVSTAAARSPMFSWLSENKISVEQTFIIDKRG